jgi:hypothetical protein
LAITASYREATAGGTKRLNDPTMMPVLSATLLLTFTTTIMTTCESTLTVFGMHLHLCPFLDLIMRRLFVVEDGGNDFCRERRPQFLTRVAMIFFETGMIYTLFVIASLGVYLSDSNLEYVASLAVRPLPLLHASGLLLTSL